MARENTYLPGITPRSVAASLLAMVLMVIVLVFGETIDGTGYFFSMHILAVPAVVAFLVLFGVLAGARALFRVRLLTRAESVCVFFSLLLAVPVMGMGFWTNFIWLSSTIPSQGDFEKIDAVSDKLWPHGPNLLEGAFAPGRVSGAQSVTWEEVEYEEGERATIPVLMGASPTDAAWLRVRVPLERDGQAVLTLGQRYLLSVLARGRDLGAGATLYARVYYDDSPTFDVEAFAQPRPTEQATFLHKKGFQRYGVYGTEFAPAVRHHVDVEFRLEGEGRVELADPKLMSVSAFESLFTGRQSVSTAEYEALRPSERAAYAVRPESPWSAAGLKHFLAGHVPARDWCQPVAAWLTLIILLLSATHAVALIMRRQWVRNERYPLPLARIPLALLGVDDGEPDRDALPAIWRNPTMWLGFAACFAWCLLRTWHAYNPKVPNAEIAVQLKPYFDDPGWGAMWNGVAFSVSAIVLSLAVFMELNVLLSLVIGFFLFRSLHWIGEAYGWNIASAGKYGVGAYPYGDEQMIGAYLTYGLLTLFFTRKYLLEVVRRAWGGQPQLGSADDTGEPEPYRAALVLLAATVLGSALWAAWVGIRPQGMLVLFGAMVLLGFVAMKIRAECGTPFAFFTPGTRLLVPMLGGMAFFGAEGTMLSSWMSLGMILLFVVPGLQMEFLEVARRARVRPRHVSYTFILGIAGGMLIGGWFFLSSLYGLGSNNAGFPYWFTARPWELYPYIEAQRVADAAVAGGASAASDGGAFNPAVWGYIGASAATAVVTVLRQWFPGFWFHPIGIVLGGTSDGLGMMMYWSFNLWGSLLTAWLIRLTVLKLGGAAAVRNKLFPFFIGVFVAAVLAQFLLWGINGYLYFYDITATRQGIVF